MAAFWASRRFQPVAGFASLAVALLDMPMVYFVQRATLEASPSASGVAGFTVGVYVLLVILAALSLETWFILFAAAVATAFEVMLQYEAGVSGAGMFCDGNPPGTDRRRLLLRPPSAGGAGRARGARGRRAAAR